MSDPGQLLFGAYRRRALALLLLHPDETYSVSEIARLTDKSPGSLHRELRALADAGIISFQHVGNQVRYQANQACPIYSELASILLKTVGMADVLREAIEPVADRIVAAAVFGSVASGQARAGSDVDVLIIGEVSFREAVQILAPAQHRLLREVNPVVLSLEAFKARRNQGDAFLERVFQSPLIFIKGTKHELGELAEDRQGPHP